MTPQYWLILSCLHWYKWSGDAPSAAQLQCPNCRQIVDVLDRVALAK